MKKHKYIILASILLLTACQSKEPISVELPASQDSHAEQNAEELWDNRIKRVEEIIATEQRYNPLPIAKVPVIDESDVSYEGLPEQLDFDSISALAIEPVYEQEGAFGGSPAVWSFLNDGNFLYFYYTLTNTEGHQPKLQCIVIRGEEIKLSCGINVGMTVEEAEAIIPEIYHFKWENPEYESGLDWSTSGYPQNWCEQFPEILIAEIDYGKEMLPFTLGLLLDEDNIIKAIAFNYPTAS